MTIDPDMEVFKKYLDGLPKIGLDYLKESLEEGDAIYEIFGDSRDFGGLNIIKIAQGIEGRLSFFYDNPLTDEIREVPTTLEHLVYYMGDLAIKQLRSTNDRYNPLLIGDKVKRKLAIQRGELILRYKLVKKNGREFEILI